MRETIVKPTHEFTLRDADAAGELNLGNEKNSRFRLSVFYDDVAGVLSSANERGDIIFNPKLEIIEGEVTKARIDQVHYYSSSEGVILSWEDFVRLGRPTHIKRTVEYSVLR
ncbi:hypothetical protein J4423_03010 [Candidatus Pacearchaeota archaeon]|nr:hypothetical protein [Candidatus Pacearchaeota archaeon]